MKLLLIITEVISAILLIATILLHSAKGEGMGGIGGQSRMFHAARGMENGLDRVTAGSAIVFLVSAALLGILP